jgi:hypothetical protein
LKSRAISYVKKLFIHNSYLLKTQKGTDFGPQILAEALIFSAILWCQNQLDILPESLQSYFSIGHLGTEHSTLLFTGTRANHLRDKGGTRMPHRLRRKYDLTGMIHWSQVSTRTLLFKGNWTYNLNYWTGGTQRGSKGNWGWCSGTGVKPLPHNLTWGLDQPDNKALNDDCLQMRLTANKTGIHLWDRNCSSKFVIACEVGFFFVAHGMFT